MSYGRLAVRYDIGQIGGLDAMSGEKQPLGSRRTAKSGVPSMIYLGKFEEWRRRGIDLGASGASARVAFLTLMKSSEKRRCRQCFFSKMHY